MISAKSTKINILIVDSIAFRGGSKIATESIIDQLMGEGISISVLTRDKQSWLDSRIKRYSYVEFPFLSCCERGVGYFIRHSWIALFIFFVWVRNLGKMHVLGASGPGVDLSLYLFDKLITLKKIQLIHGPVALSKTIGQCLLKADLVAYLPSVKSSIIAALKLVAKEELAISFFLQPSVIAINNGLSKNNWPKKTTHKSKRAKVLWAASLLRWKGLDVLTKALAKFNKDAFPKVTICYIKPKDIDLPVSHLPKSTDTLSTLESPPNLDEIRSTHNIFISTSHQEPFGLSILEAMAAGICVFIPTDGAYWDGVLTDDVNCIKYAANSADDLYKKLAHIAAHPKKAKAIGEASRIVAQDYRAELTYLPIVKGIKYLGHSKQYQLSKMVN